MRRCRATVLDILVENLELERDDIYKLTGDRCRWFGYGIFAKLDRPDLKLSTICFLHCLPTLDERRRRGRYLRYHSARRHPVPPSVRLVPAHHWSSTEGSP